MTPEQDEQSPEKTKAPRKAVANILLLDIVLRTGLLLGRRQIEKSLLQRNFTRLQARRIVNGRPLKKSLLSYVASRIASQSVPGAMLVGGGIIAKLMIDARRSAKKPDGDAAKMPAELKDEG